MINVLPSLRLVNSLTSDQTKLLHHVLFESQSLPATDHEIRHKVLNKLISFGKNREFIDRISESL